MNRILPVLTVIAALLVAWYIAAFLMNAQWVRDQAARASQPAPEFSTLLAETMNQRRPVLPTPHQVAAGFWDGVAGQPVTSRRSLVRHGWVTLAATLAGFSLGAIGGMLLAVGIVHNRVMDLGVMPWAVASQTIPIVAIAPMVIVVLGNLGLAPIWPKAVISGWLSFFPMLVGMVAGLRSPDRMQLDQMRSWNAGTAQVFWRLRLPNAVPYLFASAKVAVAAALVGTIVGELPAGATSGLGARLLSGSYNGQTVQIWSALIAASILAAGLVAVVGLIERITLRAMGMAR